MTQYHSYGEIHQLFPVSWRENGWEHRVIILNRGSMFAFQWREFSPPLSSAHRLLGSLRGVCLARKREESDANFPDQNMQRHSVTSLETARSLDRGGEGGGGWGSSMYSVFPGNCSLLSLFCLWEESMGGA